MSLLSKWWRFRKESLSQEWNLGLERTMAVAERGGLQPQVPVITVAGTNGKGSVCRFIEAVAMAHGLKVGLYSSPHLFAFNERIRLSGHSIGDGELAGAFEQVASIDGVRQLTVYEYDTLVAMAAFNSFPLDLIVLEVGLGGRLDAVNVWDADVAVVAAIDLDHQQWLGETREAIAIEKAGIMRAGRPVVIGDPEPPRSLTRIATELGAQPYYLGKDFAMDREQRYAGLHGQELTLPAMAVFPAFQSDNAATAITALACLEQMPALDAEVVDRALAGVRVPGRCERIDADIPIWFEVGHNEQASRNLIRALQRRPVNGRTLAVFASLADKDIEAIVRPFVPLVSRWFLPALDDPRACSAQTLRHRTLTAGVLADSLMTCDNAAFAFKAARAEARPGDQIVVFGSFLTVAGAMGEMPELVQ